VVEAIPHNETSLKELAEHALSQLDFQEAI